MDPDPSAWIETILSSLPLSDVEAIARACARLLAPSTRPSSLSPPPPLPLIPRELRPAILPTDTALLKRYEAHLDETGLASSTRDAYISDLYHLARFATKTEQSLVTLRSDQLTAWQADLAAHRFSAASRRRQMSAARGLYRYLLASGEIAEDPTLDTQVPRRVAPLPATLSREDITALLDAPPVTSLRGVRDRAMLRLLYATGLRVTELVSLQLAQLDLVKTRLQLDPHRFAGSRVFPLDPATIDALATYLRAVRPDWAERSTDRALFLTERGRAMTRQGFWKMIARYSRILGIERLTRPGVLRNTTAAHALEDGAAAIDVQRQLGHADSATTRRLAKSLGASRDFRGSLNSKGLE